MNEARRRAYLDAMGITLWRSRACVDASAGAGEGMEPEAHAPAPRSEPSDALPGTECPLLGSSQRSGSRAAALHESAPDGHDVLPGPESEPPSAVPIPPALDEPPQWTEADPPGMPADDAPDVAVALLLDAPDRASAAAIDPVASMDWQALKEAVAGCRACGLCERRHNTVFGVGAEDAELMLVGEAPGQDEDLKGEPFVGRAGRLLDRMLAAAGLKREQVYIANVVKCRPPNNRNPGPDEAAACRAYLLRQIALVKPKLLVGLGGVSAGNLLGTNDSVGRLRGRLHEFGPDRTTLLVTYHPSYYLRSPAEKAKGWQDLQRIVKLLRERP